MFKLKNILVPIDFSANSVQAYEFALYLALKDQTTLHLMHIIDPVYFSSFPDDKINEKILRETRINNAKEELKKFTLEIPRKDIKVVEVLSEGVPHEQIIRYSINNPIDVIILSSHGWTGLTHLSTGNVACKIMQHSEVPVICVKANILNTKRSKTAKYSLAENWVG